MEFWVCSTEALSVLNQCANSNFRTTKVPFYYSTSSILSFLRRQQTSKRCIVLSLLSLKRSWFLWLKLWTNSWLWTCLYRRLKFIPQTFTSKCLTTRCTISTRGQKVRWSTRTLVKIWDSSLTKSKRGLKKFTSNCFSDQKSMVTRLIWEWQCTLQLTSTKTSHVLTTSDWTNSVGTFHRSCKIILARKCTTNSTRTKSSPVSKPTFKRLKKQQLMVVIKENYSNCLSTKNFSVRFGCCPVPKICWRPQMTENLIKYC